MKVYIDENGRLLGIELDDEGLFNFEINVLSVGNIGDLSLEVLSVEIKPSDNGLCSGSFENSLKLCAVLACRCNGDSLADLCQVGGNINALAVDLEMTVYNKLTSLSSGGSPTKSVDYVVEAALKDSEKVLTGDALLASSHFVIMMELVFQNAVVALGELLSSELETIFGSLLAALAVLTGDIVSALDSALFSVAAIALEEKLLAFSAAESAYGACISCHLRLHLRKFLTRRGVSWGDGIRCGESELRP